MPDMHSTGADETWDRGRVRDAMEGILGSLEALEVVREKGPKLIVRWPTGDGGTIIAKFWKKDRFQTRIRRRLGISSADYEWRNLNKARRISLRAPRPYGRLHFGRRYAPFESGLLSEDLGNCTPALFFVKNCVELGQEEELARFEDSIIEMTRVMVRGGLLDSDHGMMNLALSGAREPVRLDLEMARCVRAASFRPRLYGRMLGRLITTHAFAVQPAAERSISFVDRLAKHLEPPAIVKKVASAYFQSIMKQQERERQRTFTVELPW